MIEKFPISFLNFGFKFTLQIFPRAHANAANSSQAQFASRSLVLVRLWNSNGKKRFAVVML